MPKGAMPALIASVFLSFGIGSTGGVVQEILYARLYHHYDGLPCSNFGHDLVPEACRNGADNAQEASASLGTRVDQIGDLMTKLEPIWSSNLVKNSIWSTHLVTQQYPPISSSNLVKFNLVRIDHTGSDNGQSGQSNLVNQTNMVKPIWSTRPIRSIPLCQPDQSGQST
jgi:hypothetical protein